MGLIYYNQFFIITVLFIVWLSCMAVRLWGLGLPSCRASVSLRDIKRDDLSVFWNRDVLSVGSHLEKRPRFSPQNIFCFDPR